MVLLPYQCAQLLHILCISPNLFLSTYSSNCLSSSCQYQWQLNKRSSPFPIKAIPQVQLTQMDKGWFSLTSGNHFASLRLHRSPLLFTYLSVTNNSLSVFSGNFFLGKFRPNQPNQYHLFTPLVIHHNKLLVSSTIYSYL